MLFGQTVLHLFGLLPESDALGALDVVLLSAVGFLEAAPALDVVLLCTASFLETALALDEFAAALLAKSAPYEFQ